MSESLLPKVKHIFEKLTKNRQIFYNVPPKYVSMKTVLTN